MFLALALVTVVAALLIGYAVGRALRPSVQAIDVSSTGRNTHEPPDASTAATSALAPSPPNVAATIVTATTAPTPPPFLSIKDAASSERARLIRSYEAEAASLRALRGTRDAALSQLADLARDRHRLFGELAQARGETARYRQLVVDLENAAPPPLLGAPGTPDNLKMIVGIGPVLERMLYQLGVSTYRQIARWTERDIDDFDAKLPEFPGRIRRDDWVTQARALHQSTYGENLPLRDSR